MSEDLAALAGKERAAIVAWMRRDAAEYVDGGPYGKVAAAAIDFLASQIERGEHLQETPHGS